MAVILGELDEWHTVQVYSEECISEIPRRKCLHMYGRKVNANTKYKYKNETTMQGSQVA